MAVATTIQNWQLRCLLAVTVLAALALSPAPSVAMSSALAETAPASPATDQADAESGDLASLVAPIALYPDPVLALVLQASTQPLQVVQAERFLEKRKRDPKLAPDAAWDRSVLGLLNYPNLVKQMNEYIDWTETLGDAVVSQLDDVQGAIQDIRWGAYNTGILVSSKQQTVEAEGDIIRILPADPKTVSIPKYDPKALLAAIEPPEVVEEEVSIPAPAKAAPPAAPAAQQVAPAAAPAPAPADAGYAAAPAYAPPTAYAPAPYTGPPVVSYAEPQTGFWESAATFTGGAIVGGLLGYALADDDDDDDDWGEDWFDDDDHGGGRNVNIEDSTIVVGGDRYNSARVQKELQNRRGRGDRTRSREQVGALGAGEWQRGGVAPSRQPRREGERVARAEEKRQVRLPNAGTQPDVTRQLQERNRRAQAPRQAKATPAAMAAGYGKRERTGGGVAAVQAPSQTRKTAERGARSQAARAGGGQVVPASLPARGGDGLSGVGRGDKARRDSTRGERSRGGGGGGGRGGGGGGRGGGR